MSYETKICPAFVDETGILSGAAQQQPIYGLGVLIIPDTGDITESFYRLHFNFSSTRAKERRNLRKALQSRVEPATLREIDLLMHSTRHHEYKFSEVTRFNLQQYIDLLNLYFSFPQPQFHAMLLNRLDPSFSLDAWKGDIWSAYVDLTRDLLERRLERDVFVIADLQGKPDHSPVYLEDTLCSVPAVKGCLRATSDMSVYLQLVDVLLGCVQFDLKDAAGYYGTKSRRAEEKRRLVDFIKSRLGMTPEERFLTLDNPQREWESPSRFTVIRRDW